VVSAARTLRERLGEAAGELGVQLPTFVLFTKADALPHFEAYVRNFSADEAREPLGAALAADEGVGATYAERAGARVERAVHELYRSLASRRMQVLSREHANEWKPGAYEFPREIRKLAPLMSDFLRELGRPSELRAGPVLRGFYFTGVQAVFVNETTPEYVPAALQARAAVGAHSATGVFSPEQIAAAASPVAPSTPRTRKVPRWNFLPRLLREVVLGDEAAIRFTQGGERVGFLRRATLAAAVGVALLLSMAFAISYRGNRALQRGTSDAARGIAAIAPNNVDFPPPDALRRLDALRAQLDTLSAYEHDGPPLSLRWGLYGGSALYPEVRRAYFGGFERLMFANTRAAMLAALRGFPDAPRPNDDYGESYGLLKAYLITTTHPEKSTVEFLSPVLDKQWLAGRPLDPERSQLAQRQFDTYARELHYANPFAEQADQSAVVRARSFLRQFAGSERIYQFMLAEAAKTNASVQFNRRFPGSAQYIVDSYEVPAAFTKGGFAFMQNAFKTVDRFLQGESWVVGEDVESVDKAKLVADLRARYATDYVEHWRQFLRSAAVARYGNVRDAAQKLTVLSGNQSPLLSLLSLASRNTAVALPEIASVFQPVQTVMPPTDTTKLIGQTNQPYMSALVALQSSLEQAAAALGPAAEAAAGQAAGSAATAKTAARQIAASFTIDQQGQVHSAVQKLMEDPISNAEALLTRFGADQINARTRAFCAAARPLLTKLPFNPATSIQASIAEVSAILRPGSGALWTMYNDVLQNALPKQGTQYAPVAGNVRLSPSFIALFNRLAAFSDVLFAGGAQEPHLSVTVQPQLSEGTTSVALTLEGEVVRASRNSLQATRVDWPGINHDAKLSAQFGSAAEATLVGPYAGPWALFQLFYDADAWQPAGAASRAEWSLRTRGQGVSLPGGAALKVSVDVSPAPVAAVLRRGYFAGVACGGEAAR
jgi:type VI secretion system protein ImpL